MPHRSFRRSRQCEKCPWKVATDPNDIPGAYSPDKHARLMTCQQGEGTEGAIAALKGPLRIMACHEAPPDDQYACVGWLDNQLNDGNNLMLRIRAAAGELPRNLVVFGEQHPTVEAMCATAGGACGGDNE